MERTCKVKGCSNTFFAYTTIQNKCREHAMQAAKPIAQRGKKTIQYERWRDLIARPHLIRVYGNICQECKRPARTHYDEETGETKTENLDVAHIIGRGRDASKRMDIKNVRLLCRRCHRLETDGKL